MLQIREMLPDDAESVCYINSHAFGYDFPLEDTTERLKNILQRTADKLWVACFDGKVVGYIHGADYECTYSAPLKNIMAIAVLEEYRGYGIGKSLLVTLEQWAKDSGCAGVRLVSGMNRMKAHEFYMHLGYCERKTQKNFIKLFDTEK